MAFSDIKIGISPIGWSNDDLPSLGGETSLHTFLDDAKRIGFDGIELGNKFPKNKQDLYYLLLDYDLELAGGWFSGNLLKWGLEAEKDAICKEIEKRLYCGCSGIVYAECSNSIQQSPIGLSKKPLLSQDAIKAYAEQYSLLHEFAKAQGITLAYHHHMGSILQNEQEIDLFLESGSKEIGLTFDSGHYYFARANPLKQLQKHQKQIYHVHLKDVRDEVCKLCWKEDKSFLDSILEGVFTTPGDGVIDFVSILDCLKENDYGGWIVIEAEQDPKKANPYTYSKKAFDLICHYLRA